MARLVLAAMSVLIAQLWSVQRSVEPRPLLLDGRQLMTVSRQTSVEIEGGPVMAARISAAQWREFADALPASAIAVPLRVEETTIGTSVDDVVGAKVVESNRALEAFIAAAMPSAARACVVDTVFLPRRLVSRLDVATGDAIRLGRGDWRVGPVLDDRLMDGLMALQPGDVYACRSSELPASASIDKAIVAYPTGLGGEAVRAVMACLTTVGDGHQTHWVGTTADELASRAIARRIGWVRGLEALLWLLAAGFVVVSVLFRFGSQREHDRIRRTLGETGTHAVRRMAGEAARSFVAMAIAIIALVWVSTPLVFVLVIGTEPRPGDIALAGAWGLGAAAILGLLGILIQVLAAVLTRRGGFTPIGSRAAGSARPFLTMAAIATGLCGAICVPAAFLMIEFERHGDIPHGYEPVGLYSASLTLLDFDGRTQAQWWEVLRELAGEVRRIPGVRSAAFIDPAPWSYRGTRDVLAGDDAMLLNVAISEGALPTLGVSARIGRDLDDADGTNAVLVQQVSPRDRQLFLPKGTVVAGEVGGIRFSPLDETGRPAVFRPLRTGIWPNVHLVFRSEPGASPLRAVEKALGRFRSRVLADAIVHVDDVLGERARPVRVTAAIAVVTAAIALVLLAVVLLATIRLYVLATRRSMAIRLCVGAAPSRVAVRATAGFAVAACAGWTAGTGIGLAIWRQLVDVIQDYQLVQPWSAWWLLPIAGAVVAIIYFALLRRDVGRIDIAAQLQA